YSPGQRPGFKATGRNKSPVLPPRWGFKQDGCSNPRAMPWAGICRPVGPQDPGSLEDLERRDERHMRTITCPACAKILCKPEEGGDRPFQCPACGAVFQHPEGSAELTNIAKTGTDHRIQATNPVDDFHPGPAIRTGL